MKESALARGEERLRVDVASVHLAGLRALPDGADERRADAAGRVVQLAAGAGRCERGEDGRRGRADKAVLGPGLDLRGGQPGEHRVTGVRQLVERHRRDELARSRPGSGRQAPHRVGHDHQLVRAAIACYAVSEHRVDAGQWVEPDPGVGAAARTAGAEHLGQACEGQHHLGDVDPVGETANGVQRRPHFSVMGHRAHGHASPHKPLDDLCTVEQWPAGRARGRLGKSSVSRLRQLLTAARLTPAISAMSLGDTRLRLFGPLTRRLRPGRCCPGARRARPP